MKMLSGVPSMMTLQGRKELVDIVVEQAELDSPFDVSYIFSMVIINGRGGLELNLALNSLFTNKHVKIE